MQAYVRKLQISNMSFSKGLWYSLSLPLLLPLAYPPLTNTSLNRPVPLFPLTPYTSVIYLCSHEHMLPPLPPMTI